MNVSRSILALAMMSLLAACSTAPQSSSQFNRSDVGRAQVVQNGQIVSLRAVTITNDSRGIATATGAVLGGIAGSAIGGGTRANAAGAVAGGVAGGAIGNAMSGRSTPGVEISVRLESGSTIAVVQPGSPNDYRVGDRVRVTSDGRTTRVSR